MSQTSILEYAIQGRPIPGLRIIDTHGHVGPWPKFYTPDLTAEGLLRTMDAAGIEKTMLFSNAAVVSDASLGNRLVDEFTRRHPDRTIPIVFPNVRYPEETLADLKTYVVEKGWKGIKIHPDGNLIPADQPEFKPVFRFAADHDVPVFSHTWDSIHNNVAIFDRLATEFPTVPIICAHCFKPDFRGAARLAQKHRNIYLELTDAAPHCELLEWLVHEIGAEKIVFGTDAMGWFSALHGLGPVLYADITDADKRKILGENAIRIWKLR